jgi:hypothetical protein
MGFVLILLAIASFPLFILYVSRDVRLRPGCRGVRLIDAIVTAIGIRRGERTERERAKCVFS